MEVSLDGDKGLSYSATVLSIDGKIRLRATREASDGDSSFITVNARVNSMAEATQTFFVDVVGVGEVDGLGDVEDAFFDADSNTPGKVTRYEFTIPLKIETNTLIHDMVIELEDFGFPSAVGTSSVAVTTNSGTSDTDKHFTFTPEDVAISGEKLLLSMGDITEDTAGVKEERSGIYLLGGDEPMIHMITVVIRTTAGISNPTESKSYKAQVEFGTNDFKDIEGLFVPRVVGLG